MPIKRYQYLMRIQYLEFRFSGWQKQPGRKTVEGMLLKTFRFVLPNRTVKIVGAGRTDAKVSAEGAAFELFVCHEPLDDLRDFVAQVNANLPPDIKVTHCMEKEGDFNIIKDIKEKEYHYFFSFGGKNHPFCAPFMANFTEDLDIEKMKKAAPLFTGAHNFKTYTVRHQKKADYWRTIQECSIKVNTVLSANFFPERSYMLVVRGKGFMRYQIRMIMGALIQLGRGELNSVDIEDSLSGKSEITLTYVAPGSGLILHRVLFE